MRWCRVLFLWCLFTGRVGPAFSQDRLHDFISIRPGSGYPGRISDTSAILRLIDSGRLFRFSAADTAGVYFRQAAMESDARGFSKGRVLALTGLAETSLYSGRYEEAAAFYREALAHSGGLPLKIVSDIYNGLAGVHIYKSDYVRALYFYHKYLEIAGTSTEKNPPLARTYSNLSATWRLLRDEQQRYRYTVLAEKAAVREQDTSTLGIILFRKGNYFLDTNAALALVEYNKALEIGLKLDDPHTIIASLLNIGTANRLLGNREKALHYSYLADSVLSGADENPYNKLSFRLSLGEGYFLLGMDKVAEDQVLKAISLAEKLNTSTYLARAYNLLSHIYERTGRYNKAFSSQKRYLELIDSHAGEQTVQAANSLELRYLSARQDRSLALHQLEISRREAEILRKNILIGSIVGGGLLLIISILVILRNMRTKNRIQQESIRLLKSEKEIEQMKAIMKGEDQESIRIGQELHDGIGSMLSVIKMNLSMIRQEELIRSGEYKEIIWLIDKASTDLRETAHHLMLDSLLQGGLEEALQLYCEKSTGKYQVEVRFLSYGYSPQLPADFARSAYRIIRELIYRSVKQKKVTLVAVQLNWQEDMLSIIVEDDGVPDARTAYPSGMEDGIRSRIGALNGCIDIEYAEDKGTTIDIEFDLRQIATEG